MLNGFETPVLRGSAVVLITFWASAAPGATQTACFVWDHA